MNGPTSSAAPFRAEVPDAEFKALVAVETAERLAVRAHRALDDGDIKEAQRLLEALTTVTTTRTCTAVKDQSLSDAISHRASTAVAQINARRPAPTIPAETNRLTGSDYTQHGLIGRPNRPGGV